MSLLKGTIEIHDTWCHMANTKPYWVRVSEGVTCLQIRFSQHGKFCGSSADRPQASCFPRRQTGWGEIEAGSSALRALFPSLCGRAASPAGPDHLLTRPPWDEAGQIKERTPAHPRLYRASGPVGRRTGKGKVRDRSPSPPHLYGSLTQKIKILGTPLVNCLALLNLLIVVHGAKFLCFPENFWAGFWHGGETPPCLSDPKNFKKKVGSHKKIY